MIIEGYTADGRQIVRHHGGITIETVEKRDQRMAEEAEARVRDAGPAMLALLKELVDIEGPCPGNVDWAMKVRDLIRTLDPTWCR